MIITKKRTDTQMANATRLRCPVCSNMRICDVISNFTSNYDNAMGSEFVIKCPRCRCNIGISVE